jgi:GNAT superfamily N-acetyltransferase
MLTIRQATPADASECGRICYEAFRKINTEHGYPPDIPAAEHAIGMLRGLFANPGFYCVVAEQHGHLIGSNCLDERSEVFGVGPITVDPLAQNHGAGAALMRAVLERADARKAAVRLLQAAFHSRSMSLYTKLGFDIREPLAVMQGPPPRLTIDGLTVRKAQLPDLDACNAVCRRVHGHDRGGELRDAIQLGIAMAVEQSGRVTAYTTLLGFTGHTVAENNAGIQALIASAGGFAGPGILVPTRNAELFRWCLAHGLRIVEPMTLMTVGFYKEPAGAWLPSILY